MAERKKKPPAKPGPEAERLKLAGDWEEMIKHALGKPPPKRGWKKKAKKREG